MRLTYLDYFAAMGRRLRFGRAVDFTSKRGDDSWAEMLARAWAKVARTQRVQLPIGWSGTTEREDELSGQRPDKPWTLSTKRS